MDDAVDAPACRQAGPASDPAAEVARWREEIERTYDGHPATPLTQSLAMAIERFDLSRTYFDGILVGVAMDLEKTRYPPSRASSPTAIMGRGSRTLCMEIFGYRSER